MGAARERAGRLPARQRPGQRPPPVLIQGETGTGKSLLARLLHDASPRASGFFVTLSCAAIPETLLEAELFGVEQGAFTGAESRPGLFRSADGGTLFLDEIGALPLAAQAKLLTVIEDHLVRALGAVRPHPVDVWIIAATSADLRPTGAPEQFRQDLYHRLATIPLALPPLRERGDDILELAAHFLTQACAEFGCPSKTLAPDARRGLLAYAWPGNVRELANVMERVALLSEESVVTLAALDLPVAGSTVPVPAPSLLREALGTLERARIVEALERTGWNGVHAAALLRIPRTTLRRRMARYHLTPDRGSPSRPIPSMPRPARAPGRARSPSSSSKGPGSRLPTRWERRSVALLGVKLDGNGRPTTVGAAKTLETVTERAQSFGAHVAEIRPHRLVVALGVEPVADMTVRAAQAALAMERAVSRLNGDGGDTPLFEAWLGLPAEAGSTAPISPEALRLRTFDALHRLFLGLSFVRPLVLAVEDLHWIDPTSEAYLTGLVDRLAGARVLLLATSRPGSPARWLPRSHASQLALPLLGPADSLAIVRSVAPSERLPHATAAAIVAKADGNP
jgi:hypothetical protein